MEKSIHVSDLHGSIDESLLWNHFQKYGPMESIRICRDKVSNLSLGYGYVNFLKHEDAEIAMEEMNAFVINQLPIRVSWSQRNPAIRKSVPEANIVVKNLDKTIDARELYETFSQFGKILSLKLATQSDGSSKGFAYIQYMDQACAQKAIETVDGMLLKDQEIKIELFTSYQNPRTTICFKDANKKPLNVDLIYQVFSKDLDMGEKNIQKDLIQFVRINPRNPHIALITLKNFEIAQQCRRKEKIRYNNHDEENRTFTIETCKSKSQLQQEQRQKEMTAARHKQQIEKTQESNPKFFFYGQRNPYYDDNDSIHRSNLNFNRNMRENKSLDPNNNNHRYHTTTIMNCQKVDNHHINPKRNNPSVFIIQKKNN